MRNKKKFVKKDLLRIMITAGCIIAVLLTGLIMRRYIVQEKERVIDMLERANNSLDSEFGNLEEMVLSIQKSTGLFSFFDSQEYEIEQAEKELEAAADLFGKRNALESSEPFVKKVGVFNHYDDLVVCRYYPAMLSEIKQEGEIYETLKKNFLDSSERFYCETGTDSLNLCLYLYDSDMKRSGICILTLNREGIEQNYDSLEKLEGCVWNICQNDRVILGEGIDLTSGRNVLRSSENSGFGFTLNAQIPVTAVHASLENLLFLIVLVSGGIVSFLAYWGYRILRSVYETKLTAQQSQIRYLQSQINPHFLFNVLSMIEMKAALQKDHEVQKMIHQLSGFYQGKIFRKNQNYIYLKEEMELISYYLSLQSARFGEKITYEIFYDGERARYDDLCVPRLSIQPMVENAVCHGLEPKAENGFLHISLYRQEAVLMVLVEDDGVGFCKGSVDDRENKKEHSHVGLWNTDRMIRSLCGEMYGITVESEPGKGTKVCILLPLKEGEEDVESNHC